MGVFSHRNQNSLNNQKGYTKSQKQQINNLSRRAAQTQKNVTSKGKATNQDGNKGKR